MKVRHVVNVVLLAVAVSLFSPEPAEADPLEIAVQDDAAVVGNLNGRREQALVHGRELGANWLRVNVQYRDIRAGHWAAYDLAVNHAKAYGFHVQLTITGHGERWTKRKYARYVGRVVKHFKGRVERYSLYNEPNCCGSLPKLGDDTLAQTYRKLYLAGYAAAKAKDPFAKVFIGEFSAGNNPLNFLRQVFCLDGTGMLVSEQCQTLRADGVAYHPYQFTTNPLKDSPQAPLAVGIGSIDYLNDVILEAYGARTLQTGDGLKPPIFLTEFGYSSQSTGRAKKRNLPEWQRARWLPKAFKVACQTPNVKQMLQYQLYEQPGVYWNTNILDDQGNPERPYHALKNWIRSNPQCVAP